MPEPAPFSMSCSCGAIRCAVAHPLETVVNCHCTDCRKMSGCAFSSMVISPASATQLTGGEELLGAYALSDAATKYFCTRCGTPLFNTNSRHPGLRMLYLGAVDQHEQLTPSFNAFCRSKLGWVDRIPELTSYAATPT
jgi:hypothetical protein